MNPSFGNPWALLLGLLVVPILLAYARVIRPRAQAVAAGFLWEEALRRAGRGHRWPRWRHPVSLGAQCAILTLLVLAAADFRASGPREIVLVLDTSAGIGATDVAADRQAKAKRLAAEWVAALGDGDRLAIVAAGEAVCVLSPLSGDRERLAAAVERLPEPRGPARLDEAVAIARRVSAQAQIVVLADGCYAEDGKSGVEGPPRAARLPPLGPVLAAVAGLLLVVEWGLFHRRWLC